ncbi:MAG: acyl-ACP--UDP-N-acetylglucosamine O-acyltransferase [Gammaproteobacteria bacterium]|nr:acyl-ACP--UDP-N-acetylglucosamine O-acyltransferase [Gammaproteobacteria bacterium]
MTDIHPTAIIERGAELDTGVKVGPYAVIGAGVRIGAGTTIGAHAVVKGPATIGRDNRIFQFASIGDDPQDKKYRGEPTELVVGDRNTFREFCTVNRGTAQDQGVTRLGNDNWIMAYVHIAHDCVVGNDVIFSNNATLAGHVQVGDHVICSGFSAVHQFCRLGDHCFLGGFAAVTRDVPPYVMVAGQPTAPHGINAEGLKRRGFTPEQLRNLKDAYRILYREQLQLAEARARLAELAGTQPELRLLVDFIDKSERSLIR